MSNGVKTRLNFCSLWVSVFTLHKKKNYQAGLLCWKSVTSGKGNCQLTKLICHLTSWQGYHSYLWHHRRLALDYNSMKWHESRLWCKFNKLSANYIFGMPYCLYINYKFCKLVGMRTSKLPSQLSMSKMAVFTTVTAHWPTVSHRVVIRQCSNDRPQSLSRRTISYQASCGCQSWGKWRSFSWQYVSNALPDVYIMIDYICFIFLPMLSLSCRSWSSKEKGLDDLPSEGVIS